jgi:hypothetical protein
MRRATAAIVIATAIAAACSRYDEDDQGEPAPPRPQDDAAVEAANANEASVDALADAGAACVGWDLCDDFERDLPEAPAWQPIIANGGLVIDREVRFAGDRSLRCSVADKDAEATAYLSHALPADRRHLEAEVAFRFDSIPTKAMNLLVVYYELATAYTLVAIVPDGTIVLQEWLYYGDGGYDFRSVVAGLVMPGSFVRFHIEVDLVTGRASLTVGDVGATLLLATPTAPSLTAFAVGAEYTAAQNATLWIDDVRLR